MQSNNREYIGRNEFWTPSTIGLTQSMIDASINNISIKDNSSELFTVENNKLKSEYAKYWDKYEVGNDEKTIYGPDNSKLWDLDNSDTSKITATNEIRKRIINL